MTDISTPDTKLQILDLDEQLSCSICANTYYNPVTLLCQHTFCHHCISDAKIHHCPICRVKKFIPKNNSDNILTKITEIYYGTETMNKIKEEVKEILEDKEIRPKIEKEIETKLLSTLNNLAVIETTSAITLPNVTYPPAVPYQPNNNTSSMYNKIVTYGKWALLMIIGALIGFTVGEFIGELIIYFSKGVGSVRTLFYTFSRIIGLINLVYYYIFNIMFAVPPTIVVGSLHSY